MNRNANRFIIVANRGKFFLLGFFLTGLVWALNPQFATAAPGSSAGTEDFKNPESLAGLCTAGNGLERLYKDGTCFSLWEAINKNPCFKDKLSEVRCWGMKDWKDSDDPKLKKAYQQAGCEQIKNNKQAAINSIRSEADRKKAQQAEDDKPKEIKSDLRCDCDKEAKGANCGKGKNNTFDDILADEGRFNLWYAQLVMTSGINEGNLDINNGGLTSKRFSADEQGGIFNLRYQTMQEEKYKCGCGNTNSSGQSGVEWEGPSDGPVDTHNSAICAAYISLVNATEDGTLYDGGSKDSPPKGAAKVFATLRDPSGGDKQPPQLKFLTKKMENYCNKSAFSGNGSPPNDPDMGQVNCWPGPGSMCTSGDTQN